MASRMRWACWLMIALLAGCGGSPSATTIPPTLEGTIDPSATPASKAVSTVSVEQGFGAQKGFWRVFFTVPSGSADEQTYTHGIDDQLATDIASVQHTLDIAAFEFNDPVITQAVLDAKARGVIVRVVTDDQNGIQAAGTTLGKLKDAGIPVIDDGRGALMHDKFMILDSTIVWTGSWNYSINDTYRNNNNALALRSPQAAQMYEAEFNEMFVNHQFGAKSPQGSDGSFTQDGTPIAIYFAAEDAVVPAILTQLKAAKTSIRFLAFSFTLDDMGQALLAQAEAGISVQGVFETEGSETASSQLMRLFCAGLPMRQDGNPYRMHHKVIIIDDQTVLAGSFNFSDSARDSNDENLFIITDPDLAAQYTAEFNRRWAEAVNPHGLKCS